MARLSRSEIEGILREELREARAQFELTGASFQNVMSSVPSGIPFPDSVHRLKQAGSERSRAVADLRIALQRWNDLILDGTVPPEFESEDTDERPRRATAS